MTIDAQGFRWIGTQDGRVRFDGLANRVHRAPPDDATSLGGSYVRRLLSTRGNRRWAGTCSRQRVPARSGCGISGRTRAGTRRGAVQPAVALELRATHNASVAASYR